MKQPLGSDWHRPAASFLVTLLDRVRVYAPPVRQRAFWATQVLILAIAAGHAYLELTTVGALL